MIGMLQIITYLLSVYLVFKGFEILQIGLASTREDRTALLAIGVLAVVIAIAAGGHLFKIVLTEGFPGSSHAFQSKQRIFCGDGGPPQKRPPPHKSAAIGPPHC